MPYPTGPGHINPRKDAIDVAMRELYGAAGPDQDVNVTAIRRTLGKLYDAGKASQPKKIYYPD